MEKVVFHCNLANTEVNGKKFNNHIFKTEIPEEIEYFRNYGAQQGVTVKEVGASNSALPASYELEVVLSNINNCETRESLSKYGEYLSDVLPSTEEFELSDDGQIIRDAFKNKNESFDIDKTLNAAETIELIGECKTAEEVQELIGDDERITVIKAAQKKIADLTEE